MTLCYVVCFWDKAFEEAESKHLGIVTYMKYSIQLLSNVPNSSNVYKLARIKYN